MNRIIGYTIREIAKSESVSESLVRLWARKYKWSIAHKLGRTIIFDQDSVTDFFVARKRRDLMCQAGWSDGKPGQGLIWDDSRDTECPRCEGFAIEKCPSELPVFCENCGLITANIIGDK